MRLSTSATPAARFCFNLSQLLHGFYYGVRSQADGINPEPDQIFRHFMVVRRRLPANPAVLPSQLQVWMASLDN